MTKRLSNNKKGSGHERSYGSDVSIRLRMWATVLLVSMIVSWIIPASFGNAGSRETLTTRRPQHWPPKRRNADNELTEAGHYQAKVSVQKSNAGKYLVSTKFDFEQERYYLEFLTVDCFDDEGEFVGCLQLFGENSAESHYAIDHLPDLPPNTARIEVEFSAFAIERKRFPEPAFSDWYTSTYFRFSTFRCELDRNSKEMLVKRRFEICPKDRDLERWIKDSGWDILAVRRGITEFQIELNPKL